MQPVLRFHAMLQAKKTKKKKSGFWYFGCFLSYYGGVFRKSETTKKPALTNILIPQFDQ